MARSYTITQGGESRSYTIETGVGPRGRSAYESYVATTDDDPVLSEEEWSAASGGGGGGASAFTDLSDKATADIPAINGPVATALGLKANTADLGAAATSNDYGDLDNLPTLGTAAAQNTTAFEAANTAVRYNAVQSLTELQQTRARTNINAANRSGDEFDGDMVFSAAVEFGSTATFTFDPAAQGLFRQALGLGTLDSPTFAGATLNGTLGVVTVTASGTVSGATISGTTGTFTTSNLGTVSSGTWNGTVIGDSYISSASTWNAKAPGTVIEDYLGEAAIPSASAVTWDGSATLQPTLAHGHDITLTIDNPGRTGSLSGTIASGGPYTLTLAAGAGYTLVLADGADLSAAASLATGDGYELSYKLTGTVIRCFFTTFTA